jgi:predicted RNA binding protein YcfA (HicA-like mRNA interferase family)
MPKFPRFSGERQASASERGGLVYLQQQGSDTSLEKRSSERTFRTVVPQQETPAKGTLSGIVRQSGHTVEQLLDLL